MVRMFLLPVLCFLIRPSHAQVTIRITDVPQYFTPLLDSIFIAGTFNGWDPGDTNYLAIPDLTGDHVVQISGTNGDTIAFKCTRGDWPRVETMADGSFMPNRTFVYADGTELLISVADWDDTNGNHTISGNVFELDYDFYIPQLNRMRRIWMYLPPDYYATSDSFPVIYMHDGQNVFDYASSFAGEWDADGNLESMAVGGHTQAIVVGIANGEADRIDEYTPWTHPTYGGGDGALYAAFIVETLKPFIDANYKTLPGRENTVVGGSSLGGLISYYMALEYAEVFGKAFVFSPSFWFDDSVHIFTNTFEKEFTSRIYFTAGLYEDVDMVPDMETIYSEMEATGFSADEYLSVIRVDGAHSEWFWKRELDDALLWLFEGVMPLATMEHIEQSPVMYDSVSQQFILMEAGVFPYKIFDIQGKLIQEGATIPSTLSVNSFVPGIYFLVYHNEFNYDTIQVVVR